MSISERFQKLDREVATAVDAALANLRRDLEERLRANNEQTLRALQDFRAELPPIFSKPEEIGSVEDEIRRTAGESALNELLAATVAIDASKSQAEVLGALLSGSRRFASRTAIFLMRPNELRGFGGSGFGAGDDKVASLSLPRQSAFGAAADSSPAALPAAVSAEFLTKLGAESSSSALLVPLVLRDRTAAVLYADTAGSEGAPSLAGLQTLTYLAAMAIETLPFRERASTSTLSTPGQAPVVAAAVATAVATVAPAIKPVAAPMAPAAPPAPAVSVAPPPVVAEPAPTYWSPPPPVEIKPAPAPEPLVEPALPAETVRFSAFTATSFAATPVEDFPSQLPEIEVEAIPEPDFPPVWATPSFAASAAEDSLPAVVAEVAEPEPPPSAGNETVLLRSLPNLEAPRFVSPSDDTHPDAVTPPRPAAVNLTEAAPLAEARPSGSPEVRPPSDLQGPGWAFSTGRMPIAPNEQLAHEEARRLARLLVSEIRLYNEEQVEEGRKNSDIYERLKEDIDRSRQMYEERVDSQVVGSTDYFYQELVRILANGDARRLGI